MVRRVVVDSSANLFVAGTQDIVSVPMKVRVGEREFPDDANLDVGELIEAFSDEAAESSTSCPNIAEWTSAFAGADSPISTAARKQKSRRIRTFHSILSCFSIDGGSFLSSAVRRRFIHFWAKLAARAAASGK